MSDLAPMKAKSYSPGELVRNASLAFSPLKLAAVFVVFLPFLFVGAFLTDAIQREFHQDVAKDIVTNILQVIPALGFILAVVIAAYFTRRELEGERVSIAELAPHLGKALAGAFIATVVIAILYFVFKGGLWVLGWVRDRSELMAGIMRFLKFIPLIVAALAVATAVVGTTLVLYLIAAMAVEGAGITEGFKQMRAAARGQWTRIALHVFVIAAVLWAARFVCHSLVEWIYRLPDRVREPALEVRAQWEGHWVVGAFYDVALKYALLYFLPISLLATLVVLSYTVLRTRESQPAVEPAPKPVSAPPPVEPPKAQEKSEPKPESKSAEPQDKKTERKKKEK